MGVFDGDVYRLNVRHGDGSENTVYVDSHAKAAEIVEIQKADGAQAVQVARLFYAVLADESGMSFGDFYGDEEDWDDE